ncbi:MAG TPA: hypothetical protein VGI81_01540 [Tepidisphaeraceae bacterium]|jgi:hypothetical protein
MSRHSEESEEKEGVPLLANAGKRRPLDRRATAPNSRSGNWTPPLFPALQLEDLLVGRPGPPRPQDAQVLEHLAGDVFVPLLDRVFQHLDRPLAELQQPGVSRLDQFVPPRVVLTTAEFAARKHKGRKRIPRKRSGKICFPFWRPFNLRPRIAAAPGAIV